MSQTLGDAVKEAADAIEAEHGAPGPDPSLAISAESDDPTVVHLVYSLLLWEASHDLAGRALESIRASLTGLNELRVCDAEEIAGILPREMPKREERAMRLATALNAVFRDQHGLTLQGVAAMPKREARQYLDGLDGVPPFVAARMLLVSMGGHAMPADDRIAGVLLRHGVIEDAKMPHPELIAQLERGVRAADSARVYALFEIDAAHAKRDRKGSSRAKGGGTKQPAGKGASKAKAES